MKNRVLPDELLARYVTSSRWYRRGDQTVKQDAFIPPDSDSPELSVTRHLNLSEKDIWAVGDQITSGQNRNLHGRADVKVSSVTLHSLSVIADPAHNNSNHANITDWPSDKGARKAIALEIARIAHFILNPNRISST